MDFCGKSYILPHYSITKMENLLNYLVKGYENKEINFEELLDKVPYKKSKLYELFNELIKENKLVKIAEGIYKLKKTELIIPDEIIYLSKKLKNIITRKFKFTALSIHFPFIHHTPYTITYTLYVEKGSSEDFKDAISRINPEMIVLLEPKKEEIGRASCRERV